DQPDGNRGGSGHGDVFAPPWRRGFKTCFSTEAKVPTFDPMRNPDEQRADGADIWGTPGEPFGTHYWNEAGEKIADNLDGDDSRVIMDRAIPFIRQAHEESDPFLAVIWFHAPHTPIVAGPEHRELYADHPDAEQHYYGCITALDEQVGRLNQTLTELGIDDQTIVWFCSDNGPEGPGPDGGPGQFQRCRGRTSGLRGRKRSLFNGGVGVPALVKWPGQIAAGECFQTPSSTLDILPTLFDYLDQPLPDDRPVDGVSLRPMFEGERGWQRPRPIPYRFLSRQDEMFDSPTLALIDGRWKFMTNLLDDRSGELLFDLDSDMQEQQNLAESHPDRCDAMRAHLEDFVDSCRASHEGADYPNGKTAVGEFQTLHPDGWPS
ncbi:MAG: sulfatase-like hydrolase/transferase, partial [Phycisphaeraceae bacterium]|nr:sulfatase-like hydrolase/transferase [Phycisphaeraceae bacterium]